MRKYDDHWITNNIIELIRDKDELIKNAKRTNNARDWLEAKRARNFVSGKLRNLKADFVLEEQEYRWPKTHLEEYFHQPQGRNSSKKIGLGDKGEDFVKEGSF